VGGRIRGVRLPPEAVSRRARRASCSSCRGRRSRSASEMPSTPRKTSTAARATSPAPDPLRGDLTRALAAYNAGEGSVHRHGACRPTRDARLREEGARALPGGEDAVTRARPGEAATRLVPSWCDRGHDDHVGAAAPSWRYVMRNDAEEELIFPGRGDRGRGRPLPAQERQRAAPSLEVLVKGKYLRRAYEGPDTKHGRWRFIRPARRWAGAGAAGGLGTSTVTRPPPTTRPSAFSSAGRHDRPLPGGGQHQHREELRVFNGRTRYNEWVFLPGQPRVIGRPVGPPGGPPGGAFTPSPARPRRVSRPARRALTRYGGGGTPKPGSLGTRARRAAPGDRGRAGAAA